MNNPVDDVTIFDVESTGLDGDVGRFVSFGWKRLGDKKAHVISQLDVQEACKCCGRIDGADDKKLAKAIREVLDAPSMFVTWYGSGFDLKYMQTRFMAADLKPIPPSGHVDLYWTARTKLKLHSNSLGSAAQFLGIQEKKTHLDLPIWTQASAGWPKAIKYIATHNAADVRITELAYLKLRGLVYNHPRLGDRANCASCGLPMTIDKYRNYTKHKTDRVQLYCKRCRRYETRTILKNGAFG